MELRQVSPEDFETAKKLRQKMVEAGGRISRTQKGLAVGSIDAMSAAEVLCAEADIIIDAVKQFDNLGSAEDKSS